MPELGLWPFTESVTWGVTRNPWDVERTPGGSSMVLAVQGRTPKPWAVGRWRIAVAAWLAVFTPLGALVALFGVRSLQIAVGALALVGAVALAALTWQE
jgi:hypothetical protein